MEKNNLVVLMIGMCVSVVFSVIALNNTVGMRKSLTEEQVNNIVKDYIQEHPEEFIQSAENYRKRATEELEKQKHQALVSNKEVLESYEADPRVGPKDTAIKVVEFFDYGCTFCKKMHSIMSGVIESNSDVQFIFKEIPLFGDASIYASKTALAVYKFDSKKYYAFHSALMQSENRNLEEAVDEALVQVGIDKEMIKVIVNSQETEDIIKRNIQLARDIGISGAPAFVMNNELYVGIIGRNILISKIEEMRRGGMYDHNHSSSDANTSMVDQGSNNADGKGKQSETQEDTNRAAISEYEHEDSTSHKGIAANNSVSEHSEELAEAAKKPTKTE